MQTFETLDDAFVFADSLAENICETVKNYRTDYDALEAQKSIIGDTMSAQNFNLCDIKDTQSRFMNAAVWRLV